MNVTKAMSVLTNPDERRDATVMLLRSRARARGASPLDIQRNVEALQERHPGVGVEFTGAQTAHY